MDSTKFLMISTHYPPHNLGGDAFFVEYLSRELVKAGHEVHVAYNPGVHEFLRGGKLPPTRNRDPHDPTIHEFRGLGSTANMIGALSLGAARGARGFIGTLVRKVKPDIVHWHNTKGFVGAPVSSERALSLYTAHDYYAVCPRSNLLRPDMSVCSNPRFCLLCNLRWGKPPPLWRAGNRRTVRFPRDIHVIAPSDFMSARLGRDGILTDRVVHNFVPDSATPRSANNGLPNTLTYAGLMEPHKGVKTLLKAFCESANQHNLRLEMIGEGSLRDELAREVAALGLQDRIRLPGFVSREELQSIRINSIAHVIPSQWPENAPLTALEALSTGVPLIASDAGGLPEIATASSGSRSYPNGNTKALAELLISTWENRHDIEAARRKARRSYEERYTPAVHITRYKNLISDLSRT